MDKWSDRISEYIDDELSVAEREELEAHLLECADCGQTLQQLRTVVARAGQVLDRPPENDLWAVIAQRISEPAPQVVDVDAAPARRHFTFSVPQLAAAAVALMLLSSGTVYLMLQKTPAPAQQQVAMTTRGPVPAPARPAAEESATREPAPGNEPAPATTPGPAQRTVSTKAEKNYNGAISELEGALHNSRLDTATVRVLETNLRIIDKAIADARGALASDPGNPYLNRYLDETMQKKIQLLRRATGIVRART